MNTERPGRLAHDCPHSFPFDARRTIKHTSRRPSRQGDGAISLLSLSTIHRSGTWGLLGGLSSRWSAFRRATASGSDVAFDSMLMNYGHVRMPLDELRRDGCHRKPPQHWAPLTSTLVPRSLSEVRWRRQGSWSTSRGPRSAHCRDALCADLFKVLPDLHRRDQMTAERRPARARSIRATVPRAAWLEQVPLRRTGRLSPA